MPTIGTTAQMVLIGTAADPVSFELHADKDNGDTINYDMQGDPTVTQNPGELLAGSSIVVNGFVGQVWIISEAGTLNYGIPVQQRKSVTGQIAIIVKST